MTFFQEKFLYYVKIPKGNNWGHEARPFHQVAGHRIACRRILAVFVERKLCVAPYGVFARMAQQQGKFSALLIGLGLEHELITHVQHSFAKMTLMAAR
jgi:hypothetical protein